MTLEHVAIWTNRLEILKDYYVKYFDGIANKKYINPETHFESYFITFKTGARLELMYRPNIPENKNDTIEKQYQGIIHLAFGVDTRQEVNHRLEILKKDGYTILRGPRTSGDNYYEFETLDPDNNRLEVITRSLD